MEDGCILWGTRVIVPPQGRSKVPSELHEAHPGESRVKGCDKCQANQTTLAEAPLHPWEWPGLPWSRIHVVYAGP